MTFSEQKLTNADPPSSLQLMAGTGSGERTANVAAGQ